MNISVFGLGYVGCVSMGCLAQNGHHLIGVDVNENTFNEAIASHPGAIVGLSALLTTTMLHQRTVIEHLSESGLRDRVKVMVGGSPVTQGWADEIGADGFAEDAANAVVVAKRLVGA